MITLIILSLTQLSGKYRCYQRGGGITGANKQEIREIEDWTAKDLGHEKKIPVHGCVDRKLNHNMNPGKGGVWRFSVSVLTQDLHVLAQDLICFSLLFKRLDLIFLSV